MSTFERASPPVPAPAVPGAGCTSGSQEELAFSREAADQDRERAARIVLSQLVEPADAAMGALLLDHSASAIHAAITHGQFRTGRAAQWRARLDELQREPGADRAQFLGARYVIPGDPEWPSRPDDLGADRPMGLWVRGLPQLNQYVDESVALVGARAATSYGEHVAQEMGSDLAEQRWTVVSGAAYGIDGAAHRGALAVEGPTVAVLACGVERAYPRGHQRLIDHIAESGLVVSELPLGAHPLRSRFLLRNRLIAALSCGTVVVEAGLRSGARRTATDALNLQRHLMAVPGPVNSPASMGCHELVRWFNATLVTDASDVLDVVAAMGEHVASPRRSPSV